MPTRVCLKDGFSLGIEPVVDGAELGRRYRELDSVSFSTVRNLGTAESLWDISHRREMSAKNEEMGEEMEREATL